LAGLALAGTALAAPKPPKNPADITIDVAPEAVAAGGEAEVTVTIVAKPGIKIARYPQIKLDVKAQEGLVAEATARIGDKKPPPPDKLSTNYWGEVDPVQLTLTVDENAASGHHDVEGKLTYYFCVSGDFCAPARVPVKIPVSVD
jgi:hypothetical protein